MRFLLLNFIIICFFAHSMADTLSTIVIEEEVENGSIQSFDVEDAPSSGTWQLVTGSTFASIGALFLYAYYKNHDEMEVDDTSFGSWIALGLINACCLVGGIAFEAGGAAFIIPGAIKRVKYGEWERTKLAHVSVTVPIPSMALHSRP